MLLDDTLNEGNLDRAQALQGRYQLNIPLTPS